MLTLLVTAPVRGADGSNAPPDNLEFLDGDKRIVYTEGAHVPRKEYTCRRNGLFEQGRLAAGGPDFAEIQRRALVNARAQAAGTAEDFSRRIRDVTP